MNHRTDTNKLTNGAGFPCIGSGTRQTPEGDSARKGVQSL